MSQISKLSTKLSNFHRHVSHGWKITPHGAILWNNGTITISLCSSKSKKNLLPLILFRVSGVWSRSQLTLGYRWGTPWISGQFITGLTFIHLLKSVMLMAPTGNSVALIKLFHLPLKHMIQKSYSNVSVTLPEENVPTWLWKRL